MLALFAMLGLELAPGVRADEPVTRAQTQTAPATPVRVFTNADLERYAQPGGRPPVRAVPLPPPAVTTEPERPAEPVEPETPAAPAESLPPEDRVDPVPTPELRARQAELEILLQYLRAKEQWLKNPLLPAPAPPAGELLADPSQGAGRQYESTRTRAAQTETRLLRVRAMLQARGED